MADSKITALTALTAADPANDMIPIVDVSDTPPASGNTKRISINNLLACSPSATLASLNVTGSSIPANGLYLPTSNTLEFSANSLAQYRIAPLGVFSWYDGAGGTRMTLNSTGLAIGDAPTANTRLTVAAASRLADTTGQVYIRTTDSYAQDLGAQLTLGGLYNASANYAFGGIAGRKENGTINNVAGYLDFLTTTSAGALTSRMRIDSTGNVGVGVTPNSAWNAGGGKTIQLTANASLTGGLTNSTYLAQNWYHDNTNSRYLVNGFCLVYEQNKSNGGHVWYNSLNNTLGAGAVVALNPAMTLDASGNLLVGTTNTDPTLNRVNGVVVRGNAGILMRTPSGFSEFGLSVTSGIHVYFTSDNGTARVYGGNISTNGSTTAYNTTSDYRLKESVQPLVGGLARVNALKPSVYNWKSDGSTGEGFLAHELAEIVPIAVTGEKDAVRKDGSIEAQGVDLSKLVPILVTAIQELTARVQTLEAK